MAYTLSLAELEAFDPYAPCGGRERRFCCPFCNGSRTKNSTHRSLCLNTQTGAWICQRNNERGKLTDFQEEKPRQSGRELARQQLHRAFDIPKTRVQIEVETPDEETQAKAQLLTAQLSALQRLEGTAGERYLQGRGIPVEVAIAAGVKFSPDWKTSPKIRRGSAAVVFPICNRAGEIVAAQGREIGGKGKFSLGPKSQGIFATTGALNAKRIIITEAPIDALSLAVAGFPAVALCGTSGPSWLPSLCAFRRVLLAFDTDEPNAQGQRPGDNAAVILTPKLESFGAAIARLRPENGKDWNELLNVFGPDEIKRQVAALTCAEVQTRSARYWESKSTISVN